MLEKPTLTDAEIATSLQTGYGMTPTCISFLPLGQDVHAWLYRVDMADGRSYFLKIRRPPADELSLTLPRYLRDSGFEQVVAPLPARDGTLWRPAADFILLLYPFIDGRAGMDGGLTPGQWESLGAALRRLHDSSLPDNLVRSLPREQFTQPPHLMNVIRAVLAGRHETQLSSEPARESAEFLGDHRSELQRIVDRAEALGQRLRDGHGAFVLCHADIHINNVLVDAESRVWIVDWDQPLVALPERDLMCVLGPAMRGGTPGSAEEASFFRGYGAVAIDAVALTYYRYERALQDIAENAEQVYWMPEHGEETRRNAAQRLLGSFGPGRQASEAFRADAHLSMRA